MGVSRQTVHVWLARYEAGGLEALGDRSYRPVACPHRRSPELEAMVLELRRWKPYWARRLAFELTNKGVDPAPSDSAVYRSLVRARVVQPVTRQRRRETWKRWERAARWSCGRWTSSVASCSPCGPKAV
jgi:hypothetical protein